MLGKLALLFFISFSTFLPISADVTAELARYRKTMKRNGASDWVFQDRHEPGKRWQETGNSYYGIQKAFKKAGLYQKGKLTHEIRREVASTMLLNGTPIHVVKEILGVASQCMSTKLARPWASPAFPNRFTQVEVRKADLKDSEEGPLESHRPIDSCCVGLMLSGRSGFFQVGNEAEGT